jgi:hypothetical protein
MSRIDADPRSVRELLSNRKYGIDEYQREYKWGPKNIEELLNDLYAKFSANYEEGHERHRVADYDNYFLGSVILSRREGRDYIVDGQQRITSLTLLLIYLHHLQNEQQVSVPTNLEPLVFSAAFGRRSFNLDVPDRVGCLEALFMCQPFDSAHGDGSVRNMLARYADIQEQFPEDLKGTALPFFIDWLLERVELVEIAANSDDDAYTIFETMNDRGQPLSPTDMLKGYLLSNITDMDDRSQANAVWRKTTLDLIELGKEQDSDFLKTWLRAKYAQTIRERRRGAQNQDFERIGTVFHKCVRDNRGTLGLNTSADFDEFIRKLFARFAHLHRRISRAADTLTPGLEVIFYNAHNNFTLQFPVLLAPLRYEDDEVTAERKIRLMAIYLDILIVRRAVNYLSLNYSTMVYAMFLLIKEMRNKSVDELRDLLKRKAAQLDCSFTGTEDGSRAGIAGFRLNQWSKRYIHHILARLMAHVETQCGMPNRFAEYVNLGSGEPYEIEHIWANHFERHAEEFNHAEEFQRVRNQIGGLVLLPRRINQSYGDLPYGEKREHYRGENLLARSLHDQCYSHNPPFRQYIERSGQRFKAHAEFKKADVEARQELYGSLAEEIWNPSRLDEAAAS